MSLASLRNRHLSKNVFNTLKHAQSVFRLVNGRSDAAEPMTVILAWNRASQSTDMGRGVSQSGRFRVISTQALTTRDRVRIGDAEYSVTAIDAADSGTLTVHIMAYRPETRGAKPLRTGEF